MIRWFAVAIAAAMSVLIGCAESITIAKSPLAEVLRQDSGFTETELRFEIESSDASMKEFRAFCERSLARRTDDIAKIRGLVGSNAKDVELAVAYLSAENSLLRAKQSAVSSLVTLASLRKQLADNKRRITLLNVVIERDQAIADGSGLDAALQAAYQARDIAAENMGTAQRIVREESSAKAALAAYGSAFRIAIKAEKEAAAGLSLPEKPATFEKFGDQSTASIDKAKLAAGIEQ